MSISKSELIAYLSRIDPGPVHGSERTKLEGFLARCWDDLTGSGDGGMRSEKLLNRTEALAWDPTVGITFQIERHGRMALGSTRAEVQSWIVDPRVMSAVLRGETRRQIRTAADRLTTAEMREIAAEIAEIIGSGEEDERVRRVWRDEVHVVVSEIIGRCFQRTEIGRRKRFRPVLEAAMRTAGWVPLGLNRFGRPEAELAA